MINLMIIDDSALVRQVFEQLFSQTDDIQVVATAADPYIAAEKLKRVKPDVILLDVEMPRMDGITFLRKIMTQHPMPVIVCSTLVGNNSKTHMQALEIGAVDIIAKPTVGLKVFAQASSERLQNAVRGAAKATVKKIQRITKANAKLTADSVVKLSSRTSAMAETTEKLILIGASTGGTEAIRAVLMRMPTNCPPIAIVQHMPKGFTRSFAERLSESCQIDVLEGSNGMSLLRGRAIIAPGDMHMMVKRSGAKYFIETCDGPPVSRHKPSVDVLFRSAANVAGANAAAIILTGMGDDGAKGLSELRQSGALTFAQDEASSVVYGMPRAAVELGAAEKIVALENVAIALLKAVR